MSNRYQITSDGCDLYLEGGILESKYYIGPFPMDDVQYVLARKRLKLLLEHPLFDNTPEGYEIERLIGAQKRNMNKKYGRSFSMNKYNCNKYVIRIEYNPEMVFVLDAYSCNNTVVTRYTISFITAEAFTKGINKFMIRHGLRSMIVESIYDLEKYCSGDHGISIKRNGDDTTLYTIARISSTRELNEKKDEKPSESTVKPLTDDEITAIREIIAERGIKTDDMAKMVQENKSDTFYDHEKSEPSASGEEHVQDIVKEVAKDTKCGMFNTDNDMMPSRIVDLKNGEIVIIKADKSKLPQQFNYLAEWYFFENDVDTWIKVPDVYKTLAKYNELREEFVTVFGDTVASKDVISVSKVEPEWFGY